MTGARFWSVGLLLGGLAYTTLITSPSAAQPSVGLIDARLAEAIALYTGVAGRVDDARAHELMLEALEDPGPVTQMWLARCYSRGRMEFERDEARAGALASSIIEEIQRLAEDGLTEAVFLMGTAYDEALGRPEDPALAAAWFHRAADQGHVLAQHNIGNAYFAGRGVPQSDTMAVYWWTKAATAGDAIPQLRLATMYEQGRGVDVDLSEARRWYTRSAERGNRAAQEALERLGR